MSAVLSHVEDIYLGECHVHGYHGRTVCQRCRETGQVALLVQSPSSGNYRTVYVSESLLRFRGGGREKLRQEGRCRSCLRPKGPDTPREWESLVDDQHSLLGGIKGPLPGSRTLTRHHLIPERWFKRQLPPTRAVRSVDANLIPLCRPCHVLVEKDEEARRMLRRALGADEVAFMNQVAGEDWTLRRYPRSSQH